MYLTAVSITFLIDMRSSTSSAIIYNNLFTLILRDRYEKKRKERIIKKSGWAKR